MSIGDWISRSRQKWHLVESVVDGDAITRCGRRMDRVTPSGGELQVSEVMPLTRMPKQPQLCKAGCERQTVAVDDQEFAAAHGHFPITEDDASTQPEMVP